MAPAWSATVTIAVVDGSGPGGGVSVTGSWSVGSGATACTTDDSGRCGVTSSSLNKKTTSVSFTVTGLAKTGSVYDPTLNSRTSIAVTKP